MPISASVTLRSEHAPAIGRERMRLIEAVAWEGSIARGAKAAGLTPIRQDAVLLSKDMPAKAAAASMQFLEGPEARAIIEKYGHSVPERG